MSTVCCIASCVCMYSVFYMSGEQDGVRFIGMLMLFVCAMGALIFTPSMFGLMVGWDGLGVTSFLLVIYYNNSDSLMAGMITLLSNRVGDMFFVMFLGLGIECVSWGFWDLSLGHISVWMLLMVLIASMTKSAQVPFSAWLPAAMAAPTPVSTLVHSSTLVTAGIYVLLRFSEVFSVGILNFMMMFTSIMTLTLSGMAAMYEVDLKKVVALSTLSQLGVMLFGLCMGLPVICFFHLITHAYFKSMMFLCVGVLIFVSGGVQDYRFMGGIWWKAPIVFSWLAICFGSLTGLPFTSGFYSKDIIVESVLSGDSGILKVFMIYSSVGITGLYSGRVLYDLGVKKSYFSVSGELDWSKWCLLPISVLGVCALLTGYMFSSYFNHFSEFMFMNSGSISMIMMIQGLTLTSLLIWYYGQKLLKTTNRSGFTEWFIVKMWFLSEISGNFLGSKFLDKCVNALFFVEKGWCAFFWYDGLFDVLSKGSNFYRGGQLKLMGGAVLMAFMVFISFFL
ncbi:NADH dehydrogenase subunit 5 (mitochondrion) [Mya arenaria]|uniref:NADH-ubiquinone oxidoreductase chain 5 n=1 Tax=Mya arenaria TaxID=6604 RepID=A0A076J9P0_MYAAR|nr:NADH dehydrogenase subunit 5 [Mya arenaria]AII72397.1 NADH dehydrogenase subunit 5 [Mya arenaria]